MNNELEGYKWKEFETAELEAECAGLEKRLQSTQALNDQLQTQMVELGTLAQKFSNPRYHGMAAISTVEDAVAQFYQAYPNAPIHITTGAVQKNIVRDYSDPLLVRSALEWLANDYFMAKVRGDVDLPESALNTLGMVYKADQKVTTKKGKHREEYEVVFEGRKIDCGPHLCKGKHGESMLRIGFGYDEESKTVVVNYIGRHQTNTKS